MSSRAMDRGVGYKNEKKNGKKEYNHGKGCEHQNDDR